MRSGLDRTCNWDFMLRIVGGHYPFFCLYRLVISRLMQKAQYQCPPRKNAYIGYSACRFDAVVLSRFLDPGLGDAIISAYKPDRLPFYQAFMRQ
jgi:hypothetical protein